MNMRNEAVLLSLLILRSLMSCLAMFFLQTQQCSFISQAPCCLEKYAVLGNLCIQATTAIGDFARATVAGECRDMARRPCTHT